MVRCVASRSLVVTLVMASSMLAGSVTQAATEKQPVSQVETVVSHTEAAPKVNGLPLFSSQTVLLSDKVVSTRTTSSSGKADADATGLVGISSTVRTITKINTFKSLVGLTVIQHTGRTWFTFGGGYLYDTPKGYSNDWWTAPLNYVTGETGAWDWYNPGLGGTGRSSLRLNLTFGVPTPWGPIGSTSTSRIITSFTSSGSWN